MTLHSLKPVPPPWTLMGRGFVFVYRFSDDFIQSSGWVPAPLQSRFSGGLGAVMLVDYATSPVGPYQELLFVPGMFSGQDNRNHFSITKIYVSTLESVVSGWHNWGIPKERADFRFQKDRVTAHLGEDAIADFFLRSEGPFVPLNAKPLQPDLRTLLQMYGRQHLLTTLSGTGWVRPARLMAFKGSSDLFPDLTHQRPIAGFEVKSFNLNFPVPERKVL
ncbi:acetoacetate decarboxylase family protein [Deinococcus cellulosilyticus]|uniref:Acetoacetate decarboxylase n=1 Tax=Deinococcus cellulosilyticus (strain DSM 18568 / NBRC 106333 / KACC 11606 / 5516J-15) TaxID=1223518 RepID=A0A511MX60_DEIC1|nr:acetoacetate decarboxylase family protein [Deinococcus cellulosilyticus]GEM45150.1 hypothetical protein DC3_07850 [Deinococcus cellulosilyticus NBRC 106333 = KACC 11606]